MSTNFPMTVEFGLGLSSNLWNIGTYSGFAGTRTLLFDFDNLGGATVGTPYTLIDDPTASGDFTVSEFGVAPQDTGWNGTFNVTSNSVTFTPTAIPAPEPSALLLLAAGGICFVQRNRRRLRRGASGAV
jgi:hypothetical protein